MMKGRYNSDREEVIKVCFVLDRIPSYILVISRKFAHDHHL